MGAWWPACTQRRAARRGPVFASMRVRRDGFRGIRVLVLLTFLVIMTSGPIENLGLKGLRRDARGMFEHHSAAEDAGPDESHESHDAQRSRDYLLLRRQAEPPDHFPNQHDGKDAHRQERHRLVLLHDL